MRIWGNSWEILGIHVNQRKDKGKPGKVKSHFGNKGFDTCEGGSKIEWQDYGTILICVQVSGVMSTILQNFEKGQSF